IVEAADRPDPGEDRARGAAAVVSVQYGDFESALRFSPFGESHVSAILMANLTESMQPAARGTMFWIGWVMSGLVILFLLMDAVMKLLALPVVLETSGPLGFAGASMART